MIDFLVRRFLVYEVHSQDSESNDIQLFVDRREMRIKQGDQTVIFYSCQIPELIKLLMQIDKDMSVKGLDLSNVTFDAFQGVDL